MRPDLDGWMYFIPHGTLLAFLIVQDQGLPHSSQSLYALSVVAAMNIIYTS